MREWTSPLGRTFILLDQALAVAPQDGSHGLTLDIVAAARRELTEYVALRRRLPRKMTRWLARQRRRTPTGEGG